MENYLPKIFYDFFEEYFSRDFSIFLDFLKLFFYNRGKDSTKGSIKRREKAPSCSTNALTCLIKNIVGEMPL